MKTSGQCIDTADFNTWINTSSSSQSWTVISSDAVKEVEESIPPVPNFYVSNQELINVRFSFDMNAMNSPDQDFIGFVVGYDNPFGSGSNEYRYILFDWKAKTEVAFSYYAKEGFTLTEFHGAISPDGIPVYFWGHNGLVPNSICTPIAYSYGEDKGWQTGKSYHFEVSYTTGNIMIELDGNKIFDIDRYNQPGRIGFYTYSQHNVRFSDFTWKASAYANIYPLTICTGDSVYFSMTDSLSGSYNPLIQDWQWSFGDGSSNGNAVSGYHIYQSPGTFPLEYVATFAGGCSDTVFNLVTVQAPILVDLGPDTTLFTHSGITLTAGPDQHDWIYQWSNGSVLNQIILQDLENDTSLWVIVIKGLCSAFDQINIHIIEPPTKNVFVPNAFSPDNDGFNDTFFPVFKNIVPDNFTLLIYNRWGQLIYETDDPGEGWDGTIRQTSCPADIYIYLILFTITEPYLPTENETRKGTLMLVR